MFYLRNIEVWPDTPIILMGNKNTMGFPVDFSKQNPSATRVRPLSSSRRSGTAWQRCAVPHAEGRRVVPQGGEKHRVHSVCKLYMADRGKSHYICMWVITTQADVPHDSYDDLGWFGGFLKLGYPHSWMVFVRENPSVKWMMTRATRILGNAHIDTTW